MEVTRGLMGRDLSRIMYNDNLANAKEHQQTQLLVLLPKHAHDVPHVRPPVLGRPHHLTTEPIDATYFILEGRDAATTPKIVALRRYQSLALYG